MVELVLDRIGGLVSSVVVDHVVELVVGSWLTLMRW